jgi:transposase
MASLTAKTIHGRTYYYLRECQRVDGKPKITRQLYLGSAEEVAAALKKTPTALAPLADSPVFDFGAVAAVLTLASDLEVVDLIDREVPKRGHRGPSVGTYLLIAAINRCARPLSKAKLGDWFAKTSLPRLMKVKPSQLTSQRFWDNMDRVSEGAIRRIEQALTRRVVERFDLDLGCLFYDATNFFTFIDSFNARSTLAQRGKSKEGRASLRILGLALLVSGQFHVPLFHRLYPGNQTDAPTFRSLVQELIERHRLLTDGALDLTLVFDKGNNAADTIDSVADSPWHFVGSLVPTQHPDLLRTPPEKLPPLQSSILPEGVRAHRTKKTVFGREFTVLVTYNPRLFEAQTKTIEREVAKHRQRLEKYRQYTERWRRGGGTGRAPTIEGTRAAVAKILRGRHMKDLFAITIQEDPEANGLPRMRYRFRGRAYDRLQRTLLGKTLLFTDREDWTDEQIVVAYRGQHHVESAFRQMKDVCHVSFRPAHHWTDQKLHVHAFTCVIALLLSSLLRQKLHELGIDLSTDRMFELLGTIREVHHLTSSGRGRPRTQRGWTRLDPEAQRLFDALGLSRLLDR